MRTLCSEEDPFVAEVIKYLPWSEEDFLSNDFLKLCEVGPFDENPINFLFKNLPLDEDGVDYKSYVISLLNENFIDVGFLEKCCSILSSD